jgi:hypothetical protein
VLFVAAGLLAGITLAYNDTFKRPDGESFNLEGTSAWPTEFIRFGVFAFSVIIIVHTQRKLAQGRLELTRKYRLNLTQLEGGLWKRLRELRWLRLPDLVESGLSVDVNQLWNVYEQARHWFVRLIRVGACVFLYFSFFIALSSIGVWPSKPLRGSTLLQLDTPLLMCTILAFLFVTFWMIDMVHKAAQPGALALSCGNFKSFQAPAFNRG